MGMYEDMELSASTGQWGFAVQLKGNTTQQQTFADVISVSSPGPTSQAWTVTLAAFRYNIALPPGATLGNTQPADNETWTGGSSSLGVQVSLLWGTANGSERAIVDYPARGCTFQVQASYLRMGILVGGATGAVPPALAGFVSPEPRVITCIAAPTNTSNGSPLIAASGSRRYPIPDRAVAYRWSVISTQAAAFNLVFTQQDGDGAQTQLDFVGNGLSSAGTATPQQGRGADYIMLHPRSQFVSVFNADVLPTGVILSFLLDLG